MDNDNSLKLLFAKFLTDTLAKLERKELLKYAVKHTLNAINFDKPEVKEWVRSKLANGGYLEDKTTTENQPLIEFTSFKALKAFLTPSVSNPWFGMEKEVELAYALIDELEEGLFEPIDVPNITVVEKTIAFDWELYYDDITLIVDIPTCTAVIETKDDSETLSIDPRDSSWEDFKYMLWQKATI